MEIKIIRAFGQFFALIEYHDWNTGKWSYELRKVIDNVGKSYIRFNGEEIDVSGYPIHDTEETSR